MTKVTQVGSIISLKNFGQKVVGHLGLKSKVVPEYTNYVTPDNGFNYKFTYMINELGSFSIKLKGSSENDLSYFAYRCFQQVKGENEIYDQNLTLTTPESVGKEVDVECFIFDLADGVDFKEGFEINVTNETKKEELWSRQVTALSKSITKIENASLTLKEGNYEVVFETLNGATIELGEIKIYP